MTFDDLNSRLGGYVLFDVALALAALGVWLLWRWVVPPRLGASLPVALRQSALVKFGTGMGLGLLALLLALAPGYLSGGFAPGPGYAHYAYAEASSYGEGGLIWAFYAVQSLFEELAFRGVALGLLGLLFYFLACLLGPRAGEEFAGQSNRLKYQRWAWLISGGMANLAVALAFGWVHQGNPHIDTFALMNIVLAGLVLGQLYWQQGQALGAWGWHWVWNAGQTTLGLPVSGIAICPPLLTGLGYTGARAGTLTGGAFGLEASWPCTAALTLMLAWLVLQQCEELKRLSKQH